MISPSDISVPIVIPEILLANVNLISKVSDPSTASSQVTEILAVLLVAPGIIVILNGSVLKSIPDPIIVSAQRILVNVNMYIYKYQPVMYKYSINNNTYYVKA